jgi:hypothetical protein
VNGTDSSSRGYTPAIAVTTAAVAVVNAFIVACASFGEVLDPAQTAAIIGLTNAVAIFVIAMLHYHRAREVDTKIEQLNGKGH